MAKEADNRTNGMSFHMVLMPMPIFYEISTITHKTIVLNSTYGRTNNRMKRGKLNT